MKLLTITSVSVLALAFGMAVGAHPRQQQQQPPSASIEGVILRYGSGEPVTGARATLTRLPAPTAGTAQSPLPPARGPAGPPAAIPFVTTDTTGKFAFKELEAGAYRLQILANGYVGQAYAQRYPGGPGGTIQLAQGQTMKDISITLSPTANISGRITERSGQPIPGMPVQLLRFSYDVNGQRVIQTTGTAQTNDRGEYRIYWVTPGRYYLMAGNAVTPSMAGLLGLAGGNANQAPDSFGSLYYPGVSALSGATAIVMQPGAELAGMDLAMPRQTLYRVRGRVMDSRTGQPPATATITVSEVSPLGNVRSAAQDMMAELGPRGAYNAQRGSFEVRDIAPGTYTVTATVTEPLSGDSREMALIEAQGRRPRSAGSATAVVGDSDAEGVVVTVIPPGSISGRLRIEGQPPANMTVDRLRVRLAPLAPRNPAPPIPTTGPDGTFRLDNVAPAEYRVTVTPLPAGAYLKTARLDGVDVLNVPLRFSGLPGNQLEVVVGMNAGQIEGVVTDERGQPVSSIQVVLVPDRSRDRPDLYKMSTTDGNGRFTAAGIAPGDYKVFSWEGIEPYSWFDSDFLKQWESRGRAVRIAESQKETVEVKVIPAGVPR